MKHGISRKRLTHIDSWVCRVSIFSLFKHRPEIGFHTCNSDVWTSSLKSSICIWLPGLEFWMSGFFGGGSNVCFVRLDLSLCLPDPVTMAMSALVRKI